MDLERIKPLPTIFIEKTKCAFPSIGFGRFFEDGLFIDKFRRGIINRPTKCPPATVAHANYRNSATFGPYFNDGFVSVWLGFLEPGIVGDLPGNSLANALAA